MWDNPRLLNAAAGFLVGIALLGFSFAALQALLRSELFPLRHIELTSAVPHLTREDVEAAVRGRVEANFFAVDLAAVRSGIEALPWVRRAAVRRVWPDRLEVSVEEHVALARWGDDELVNTFGERFPGRSDAALPLFLAPPGTEADLARTYLRFASAIEPLGATLERVVLTPRLAWQLRLGNGLHLMLGRDAEVAEARLRRFVAAYSATLERIAPRHEYVDLRYPNGFAVRMPEAKG